jgi:phage portal protein BeeE
LVGCRNPNLTEDRRWPTATYTTTRDTTNSEAAGRWFAQFTLGPWARKTETAMSRALFPVGSGYELELDLSGFLRGDPQTRWAAHKIAVDSGILDPDEVREIEGFNPRRPAAIA